MNCKQIVFVFSMFIVASMADDSAHWIRISQENAVRDLEKWPGAVKSLANNDSSQVTSQVDFFKSQVSDSVDNMDSFIPQLTLVVNQIYSTASEEPNSANSEALEAILSYITGKRDNKSYYLLDGAGQWVDNRLADLAGKGRRAKQLAVNLSAAQQSATSLRDQLDTQAQFFVNSIAKLNELSYDIAGNIVDIRTVSTELAALFAGSTLLANAKQTNDLVKAIIA